MGRSLWYPPASPLMLLTYCADSKRHNDEKLVLCGGHSCPTSSISLSGEFPFCWLYLFIAFLIFLLAQFQLQTLEVCIHVCFFLFCQYIVSVILRNDITDSNIHQSIYIHIDNDNIIIFTKAVYFKPFFQGKLASKFIITINWNYTRKLLTIAAMQIGSRSSTPRSVCWSIKTVMNTLHIQSNGDFAWVVNTIK